ncbi:uncharacterized protein [Littorina saxatilis]|uniref:uncharacterized protein n=1 Tax=Littorina saxatilis TaxID=31220 RepID=UPI0038B6ADFF
MPLCPVVPLLESTRLWSSKAYHAKGVSKAVSNVNDKIAPAIIKANVDLKDQKAVDNFMLKLDGTRTTPNKETLGANAILAVSMAACTAGASEKPAMLEMREALHLTSWTTKKVWICWCLSLRRLATLARLRSAWMWPPLSFARKENTTWTSRTKTPNLKTGLRPASWRSCTHRL